jgi:protoheme IX farnesyltransferase
VSADAPGRALDVSRSALSDYVELTKPRITTMVVMTALVGFIVGAPGPIAPALLASTLLGTGLVAAGSAVLNMLLERRTDGLMLRTRNRPLPAGRVRATDALGWGLLLTSAGLTLLAWTAGPLAAGVALVTWLTYVFAYTPLKTRTSLATIVGAFPGALPPVIGWAAAAGRLEPGTFVLFAILFLWQIPHFLAIAWIYRDDYARGGLPMLPVLDPDGRMTGRQAVAHTLALTVISLTPTVAGMTGPFYFAGAALLGAGFTAAAAHAAVARTSVAARRLFLASLAYLTALSALLLLDRA